MIAGAVYLALNWPFTEQAVIKSLQDASSSQVTIGSFRGTYFPHPGCIAHDVVFRRGTARDIRALISIQQLTVQSTFLGMIRKHIALMRANGMQIFIPSKSTQKFKSSSQVVIDQLIASGVMLKFESRSERKPLEFAIHEADLRNVGGSSGMRYRIRMSNPEPPGEIEANGTFGPWIVGRAGETKVSGHYRFERADLGVFKGIAGMLSSSGDFQGTLDHIAVSGSADTPDFAVTSSSHQTELKNQFRAFVDARNGDVFLQQVDSQFRRTELTATGKVAPQPEHPGRETVLDVYSKTGRIQDLLLLFINDERAPMKGVTSLRAHIILPPNQTPFLQKVELMGDFGIDAGTFTKEHTQEETNKLSAESRDLGDNDAATVLSKLKGHVEVKDGTATFSDLSFSIPGALAEMHGTFELTSHRIDLHGTLQMDSSLSHLAHGPKALILKVMAPFFRRKPKGSRVPVRITGTYENPSFGLDLNGQKETETSKRLRRLYTK